MSESDVHECLNDDDDDDKRSLDWFHLERISVGNDNGTVIV